MFGLGNKKYEHFCATGKLAYKCMMELGARPIVGRGDGNDDEDIDTDFEDWKANLLSAIDASNLLTRRVVRTTFCCSLDEANSKFATSHS